MTTFLWRCLLSSMLMPLFSPLALAGGESFKTVVKDKDGKPVAGVTLSVLSGGNKFNTGVTDANGEANVSLDSGNIPPSQSMQMVVRKCRHEDGTESTELIILPAGSQLPPHKNCDDRVAGIFPWPQHGGIAILVNVDNLTLTVESAGGPKAAAAIATGAPSGGTKLVTFQIGGDFGAKKFSGINNCASFLVVVPEASCSNGTTSFAGGVDGAVVFARYVSLIAAFYDTGNITRNASATGSEGNLGENSKIHTTLQLVGGGFNLPSFGHVTLSFDFGAAFQQIHQKEVQTLGSGTTSTSTVTKLGINTIDPAGGAKLQVLLTKHFGLQAGYLYIVGTHKPGVNEHNNLVTGGIFVAF